MFCKHSGTGKDPGGTIAPLKPTKVSLFTIIFYNSKNNIRDISLFCRPLFCHSSVEKYTSSILQQWTVMSVECQILLKSPPLNLLAGSAPALVNTFFRINSATIKTHTERSKFCFGVWKIQLPYGLNT